MTSMKTMRVNMTMATADAILASWDRRYYGYYGYYVTYWHRARPLRVVLAVDGADAGQVRASRSTVDGPVHVLADCPNSRDLVDLIGQVSL